MGARDSCGRWAALWGVVAALALAACGQSHAPAVDGIATTQYALNASPDLPEFALYARNSVLIGEHASVLHGDIGVAEVGSGPFLYPNYAAAVLAHGRVDANRSLLADSVFLHRQAKVGDVQTSQFVGIGSTHGSVTPFVAMPLFPAASPITPGTAPLTAPSKKAFDATPGSYGAVNVGQRGILRLASGLYQVASLDMQQGARLEALGAIELRVAGTIQTGTSTYIGPANGTNLEARDIRIEVAGNRNAVSLGTHAEVHAILLAPNGALRFGTHNVAVGAFFANDIELAQHAKVTFSDGFPCAKVSCDDGNPCTVDACVAGSCVHTALAEGTLCSDGNECNGVEVCDNSGVCQPGTPLEVDDGNPCTVDACDPSDGVTHRPVDDGTSCDDGNACTIGDSCRQGHCTSGEPVVCEALGACYVAGSCDPESGMCAHTPAPEGTPCQADACHRAGACNGRGACVGLDPIQVDDGNPCTVDACDPVLGVTHTAVAGLACNDGDACNGPDACSSEGSCEPEDSTVSLCCDGVPNVDPRAATPIDHTLVTSFAVAAAPLFEGPNAIQAPVASGTLAPERLAVINGMVFDAAGAPVPCADITILNAPEYGAIRTLPDGSYSIAVNGGSEITVRIASAGFMTAYRKVHTRWNQFAFATDVRLLPWEEAHPVSAYSSQVTIISGAEEEDQHGPRRLRLFIPPGTRAMVEGESEPLYEYAIRVKEVTNMSEVGRDGMLADLPPQVAFTYAFSLTVEGAEDKEVRFDKTIPIYNENFLDFTIGETVPLGRFDPRTEQWIAEPSGRVIRIVGIDGAGRALVDINSTPGADDPSSLGMTSDELFTLAQTYSIGTSLWRITTDHFSFWDSNWGWGPPPTATPPEQPDPEGDETADPCLASGSVIECENQVLREHLPIHGTPFEIVYSSSRQAGASRQLRIPLTGMVLPSDLDSIELEIRLGGRQFTPLLLGEPAPSQSYTFRWDGRDSSKRFLFGPQPIQVRIGYTYPGSYERTARFGYNGNGIPITASRGRFFATLWQEWAGFIDGDISGHVDGLGGWTLNVHHVLDPRTGTIYRGDGTKHHVPAAYAELVTVAGTGVAGLAGDDVPAATAPLNLNGRQVNSSVAIAADGTIYFCDSANDLVRRIDQHGTMTILAGGGTQIGDGGPAKMARLNQPSAIAVAPDGHVYVADSYHHRIRKIDLDTGIITTVAGTGVAGLNGAGPATERRLNKPTGLGFAADGTMYIADSNNNIVRRVRDGEMDTIATGFSYPTGVAVDREGSLYISDYNRNRIVKRRFDGTMTNYVGTGSPGSFPFGDGGLATQAQIWHPDGVQVGPDGSVYFVDTDHHLVRRVNANGIIENVAGTGVAGYSGEGLNGNQSRINRPRGLGIGPDGSVYIVDSGNQRLRRLVPAKRLELPGGVLVAGSKDGSQLFHFDAFGRHLRTVDPYSGATLYTFGYTSHGTLASITDVDGRVSHIERDSNGKALGILSPDGHRTTMTIGADEMLTVLSYPDGARYTFDYAEGGLLAKMSDPRANAQGTAPYTFEYDIGRFVRDTDPRGAAQTLAQSFGDSGWSVQRDTALGRSTVYDTEQDVRTVRRRVLHPDGTIATSSVRRDQKAVYTAPNGRSYNQMTAQSGGPQVFTLIGASPAYGPATPSREEQLVVLPSGLRRLEATSSNATIDALTGTLRSEVIDTSVNGLTFRQLFDGATRTFTSTTPLGRRSYRVLNESGRTAQLAVDGIFPTAFDYDAQGRLTIISQGERVQSFSYDVVMKGFLSSTTNALGETTSYRRDEAGRVLQSILPDGNIVAFGYDAAGNLTSITPPGRPPHEFAYDEIGQLIQYAPPVVAGSGMNVTTYAYDADRKLTDVIRPDGGHVHLGYDTAGRPKHVTMPAGNLSFGYDANSGKLVSATGPSAGQALSYAYDGSLLTRTTWSGPISGTVQRTFDNFFRLATETVNGGYAINYGYDDDGLLTRAGALTLTRNSVNGLLTGTTLGGVTDSYTHDGFGQVASYTAKFGSTVLYQYSLIRDALGRITRKVETVEGITRIYEYGYDARGWLTDVAIDGQFAEGYEYDANGNRTALLKPGSRVSAYYDAQDRLLAHGDSTYTYTASGELRTKADAAGVTTYTYDAMGNLLEARLPDTRRVEYVIDANGRRIRKLVDGVAVQGFLYRDRLRIVAELDRNDNIVSRFVYADGTGSDEAIVANALTRLGIYTPRSTPGANGTNAPVYMVKNSGLVYRIVSDHLGTPRLLVNMQTGAIAQELLWNAWGVNLGDSQPGMQPFGFAAGLWDRDTGLVRFGARDYDAGVASWVAKDPIRFVGGRNLYGYVDNDPLNLRDNQGTGPACEFARDYCQGTGDKCCDCEATKICDLEDVCGYHVTCVPTSPPMCTGDPHTGNPACAREVQKDYESCLVGCGRGKICSAE